MTNARVAKQRREEAKRKKEMENEQMMRILAEAEFEAERVRLMKENFQVYKCSGSQNHDPKCDGNCETVELEGTDLEIAKELLVWDELGMQAVGSLAGLPIPGIPVNIFDLEIRFQTLLDVITEKMDITMEEMNERYAKRKLERLVKIREANEEEIREARARENVGAVQKPSIILPDEIKRKMQ